MRTGGVGDRNSLLRRMILGGIVVVWGGLRPGPRYKRSNFSIGPDRSPWARLFFWVYGVDGRV